MKKLISVTVVTLSLLVIFAVTASAASSTTDTNIIIAFTQYLNESFKSTFTTIAIAVTLTCVLIGLESIIILKSVHSLEDRIINLNVHIDKLEDEIAELHRNRKDD